MPGSCSIRDRGARRRRGFLNEEETRRRFISNAINVPSAASASCARLGFVASRSQISERTYEGGRMGAAVLSQPGLENPRKVHPARCPFYTVYSLKEKSPGGSFSTHTPSSRPLTKTKAGYKYVGI